MSSSDDPMRQRIEDVIAEGLTVSDPGFISRPEVDLPRGTTVGEYVIEAAIGRGGFGTVYRAVQPLIGKRVGIKVLARKYSVETEIVSRFIAEARAVNQIRHRNIIDIFAFGQLSDGRHYYVMEYLEGEALDRHLAHHGPMSLDEALPVLRAIARALDAAHAKGIAHRDLKPANIFLAKNDDDSELFPKLLDFGIAKLSGTDDQLAHKTGTGRPIGTPYYMSPEQCRGRDVDHRTDIYSLGVVTFRMLTRSYPFDGAMIDVMHSQIHDRPPAASSRNAALTAACDRAIEWMLQKDPELRPRSATSAIAALHDEAMAAAAAAPAGAPSQYYAAIAIAEPPRRRRRWIAPVVALALAGGAAAAFVVLGDRADRGEAGATFAAPVELPAPAVAPVPAPVPAPAQPPAPAPLPALVADPVPSPYVIVTVDGAPPTTEVSVAGTFVGNAPGPVQLQRSSDPVVLVFKTEGYLSVSKPITPDRPQTVVVNMKKRQRARAAPPRAPEPRRDDNSRNTLAEPFRKH